MTTLINNMVQGSEIDPYIELWTLDLTKLNSGIYYFIVGNNTTGTQTVSWGGQVYTPFDIDASGFQWNGTGPIPTPKIRFSTTNLVITSLINTLNDLMGGTITRIRTFRKFLDDGSSPSVNEYFQKDIYVINQKTNENKMYVEFELSSPMDQKDVMLPRGKLVYYCRFKYRYWNGTSFYTYPAEVACPYAGSEYYDINNISTTSPSGDVCNKRVSGCKTRFGASSVLPFGGFPGTQVPTIG